MSKVDEEPNINDILKDDLLFDVKPLTTSKKNEYSSELLLSDDEKYHNKLESVKLAPSEKVKRRKIKIIIALILIPFIIISAVPAYIFVYKPIYAKSYYDKINNFYNRKTNGVLPENYLEKFGGLYDINKDIGGWITVSNSKIDYPIAVLGDNDSDYYNNHLFNKTVNKYGSIYFDSNFNLNSYIRNTVIHANKNFFGELSNYLDVDHYKTSPIILMDTVYNKDYWKIFAVLKIIDEDTSFDPTKNNFTDDNDFSNYVNTALSLSYVETNMDILINDRILSAICDYDGYKVVLLSRRVRSGESASVDTSSAVAHVPGDVTTNAVKDSYNINAENVVESGVIEFEPTESSDEINTSSIDNDIESTYSHSSNTKAPISSVTEESSSNNESPSNDIGQLTVKNSTTGKVVTDDVVNIIASVVEAEVGGFSQVEVLKAQAVATYTFLLYNNTSASSPVSVPMKNPQQDAIDAANAVAGEIVVYNGNLCCTYYFPLSAGKTTSCQETWGNSVSYLVSVDSSVERNLSNYMTKVVYSSSEIQELTESKLNISLSGDPSTWLSVTSHDSGGEYVTGVSVGGNTTYTNSSGNTVHISGRTIKEVLLSYGLPSHAFEIEYNASDDQFVFTVYGSGHGVGMSQYGADEYAKQGYDYIWILEHYYSGASVQSY